MTGNKKIGLALSGGGALGAAHIGIIEELERAEIKITHICGVSAGSIIGLAYAAGGINGLHSFFNEIVSSKIFQKQQYLLLTGPKKVSGFVESILKKDLKGRDFSQLPINFSCVATNISTGKKKIINNGDLIAAVMASAAYPAVMPLQKIDGDYYYDGGVTCNLPAREVRAAGADFVIGSSIYTVSEIDKENVPKMGKLDILFRTFDIFDKQLGRYEAETCDFCFSPSIEPFKIFDFTNLREIEAFGRKYARENINKLIESLDRKNRC